MITPASRARNDAAPHSLTTLAQVLTHRAEESPTRLAFRWGIDPQVARELTYRELYDQARGVALELQRRGLQGERALLLYPSGLDFIVAFFGCLLAGVVAVPAYPPRKNRHAERLSAIVNDARAAILLSTGDSLARIEGVTDSNSLLRIIPWLATDQLPADLQGAFEAPAIDSQTLAFLQYTSGSTGEPKGVKLTHGNLMANLTRIAQGFGTSAVDISVTWLPLYHDMGLIGGILQPIFAAIETTLLAPAQFLQRPLTWLEAISSTGATISGGPNFAYELCVDRISEEELDQLDLSRWEVAFNGAEPIRAATLQRFAQRFARCGFKAEAFYPCYGLAEGTLIVSGGRRATRYATRQIELHSSDSNSTTCLVGCGTSFPGDDIRVVDPDTQQEVPPGEVGEIWVAGPSISHGYWNHPDETDKTFGGRLPGSPHRYLRTGDLGLIAEGEIFVTGRRKETIIVRGVNYYPFDVEQAVDEACADLARGGCASFAMVTEGGEELGIAIESARHHTPRAQEVADRVCRQLAESHGITPAALFVIGPHKLPRTSSGKLQRLACRQGLAKGVIPLVDAWIRPGVKLAEVEWPAIFLLGSEKPREEQAGQAQPDDETYDLVAGILKRSASVASIPLTADTPLRDLGLDSLAWMEVTAELEERLGVRLQEGELSNLVTVSDLVKSLEANTNASRRQPLPLEPGDYQFAQSPEYLRFKETLRLTQRAGVENPYFTVHEGTTADSTTIDGQVYLNFCSYNYLGMSGDPVVTRAAQAALDKYGSSVSASRLVSGEKPIHAELETELASWLGVDAAITMVGGHATNVTTIGHLFGPGDLVLHDALAHNSIVQGCQLSGAERRAFRHNDPAACEQLLRRLRGDHRRVLIAIEGVYSMDGDWAPLPDFVRLKEQFQTYLLVDEAHSLGTMGPGGRGIAAHLGVDPRRVDLWMGTLSKSLGSCGGYIAASREIVEYLRYTAPGFVYSVGMTPANAAAALAALRQLASHPQRVQRLQASAAHFLELARAAGLATGLSDGTPIVPVITGSSILALQLSERLFREGINVQPILHPAVEEKGARLRFFITCDHTTEQIERAVERTAHHWHQLREQLPTAAA